MQELSLALRVLPTLAVTVVIAQEARVERISFDPGASRATIQDRIQGYETVHYVVNGRGGQTIDIRFETDHGATYFNFLPGSHEPGRDAAVFRGELGGNHYEGRLAYDGDALIEVYMMRSAARRDEVADYALAVAIEGVPDPETRPAPSGPFPVDTDASGDLPCAVGGESLERASFDRQCAFRVKRNDYGATIWAVSPSDAGDLSCLSFEDLRTLYFEGGQPGLEPAVEMSDRFSTNDGSEIRWDRDQDNWIVNIGDGSERYWVPDAVIWGG